MWRPCRPGCVWWGEWSEWGLAQKSKDERGQPSNTNTSVFSAQKTTRSRATQQRASELDRLRGQPTTSRRRELSSSSRCDIE
jgi:hypothetical protein